MMEERPIQISLIRTHTSIGLIFGENGLNYLTKNGFLCHIVINHDGLKKFFFKFFE